MASYTEPVTILSALTVLNPTSTPQLPYLIVWKTD